MTGHCSVCGQKFTLSGRQGLIPRHKAVEAFDRETDGICSGSGFLPTEAISAPAPGRRRPVEGLLREAKPEALLKTVEALTHRIHVGEGRGSRHRPMTEAEVADLRDQRELVKAEILRRIAGEP